MAVKKDGYNQAYYQKNREVILARSRARYEAKRDEIRQKARDRYYDDSRLKSIMVDRARYRSRSKDLEFSIGVDDFEIPETCPVLGITLQRNKGSGRAAPNSPSLDRIDPELGYVAGNIQVLSYKANCMKNNASVDELQLFADWVRETYG